MSASLAMPALTVSLDGLAKQTRNPGTRIIGEGPFGAGIDGNVFRPGDNSQLCRIDFVRQLDPQENAAGRLGELGRSSEALVQRLDQIIQLVFQDLVKRGHVTIEIIKRSDTVKRFGLLPRRRGVARTFAWLGRRRRLARDVEATIESAVVWMTIAGIRLMIRRLAGA